MNTQLQSARKGEITTQALAAAKKENVKPELVRDNVAKGFAVIPANIRHENLLPVVVGRMFTTKVNANIGRSADCSSFANELKKLDVSIKAGADFIMDLSVGKDVSSIRRKLLKHSPLPFGTVPIYEAFARANGKITQLNRKLILDVIRQQAEEGVDFMTIHAGLLRAHLEPALKRLLGIVSRGGTVIASWMDHYGKENPFYESFDEILGVCREYDVTVSLGDGLRPGCLADASDKAQFAELDVLGSLVKRCRAAGVQVMVEGPGHVPFNQIQANMEREQKVCHDAPFYVLGPVVTDIAPGYDHITSAIGATAAAYHGAALLCYVTPAEHLSLPSVEDVKQGIIAYRIAAHAADVAKGLPGARDIDDAMSLARREFDWEKQFQIALDGDTARKRYEKGRGIKKGEEDFCSMCGKDFCAIRASSKLANKRKDEIKTKK